MTILKFDSLKSSVFGMNKRNAILAFQVVVLSLYCFLARNVMGFSEIDYPVYYIIFFSLAIDFILGISLFGKPKSPLSAVIIALAASILIESRFIVVYLIAVFLAHLSKALLVKNGRHFFNPANFGCVLVLLFLPNIAVSVPQMFAHNNYVYYLFLFLGFSVSFAANQAIVSISWIAGFAFFSVLRSYVFDLPLFLSAAAIFSPTFLLFSFHMITDPATAPKSNMNKVKYGLFVSLIDAIPRIFFLPNSPLFSLFIWGVVVYSFSLNKDKVKSQKKIYFSRAFITAACISALSYLLFTGGYRIPSTKLNFWDEVPETYPNHHQAKFKLSNEASNFKFVHQNPKVANKLQKHLSFNYPAPGVAVEDFNNDGWLDIFIPNGQLSYSQGFFINQNGKKFINAEKKWFAKVQRAVDLAILSPVLIDVNRDGFVDVLLTGYGCPRFLINNKGTEFIDKTNQYLGSKCEHLGSSAPFDFNDDGFIDLYVAGEVPVNVDIHKGINLNNWTPSNPIDALNAQRNRILINVEGKYFKKVNSVADKNTRWSADVGIADIDQDGYFDIIVANDFGRDEYFKIKEGELEAWPPHSIHYDRGNGMNVSFLWPDPRKSKFPISYISNNWVPSHKQIGNYAWVYDDKAKALKDISYDLGIFQCGWSWAATFADFDNDSFQDLFVANGFISKKKPKNNLMAYKNEFLMSIVLSSSPTLFETTERIDVRSKINKEPEERFYDYFDLDPEINTAGFQRDCFFYNKGDNDFEEISAMAGFREFTDSRGAVAADFTNTGRLDLVVSVQEDRALFFKNQFKKVQNYISLILVDRYNNKLTPGVKVFLKGKEIQAIKVTEGGRSSFASFNGSRIHFGVADETKVDIKIDWPSGKAQIIEALPVNGVYVINEVLNSFKRLEF